MSQQRRAGAPVLGIVVALQLFLSAASAAQKPVLVYVSDGKIGEIVGRPWGGICRHGEDLEDFFERRGGRYHFPGWYNLFRQSRSIDHGRAWALDDFRSM